MSDPVVFTEVVPRPKKKEGLLYLVQNLRSSRWRMALAHLYLQQQRYIPPEAKAAPGASYGLCNAAGKQLPMNDPEATHFGWTLDPQQEKDDV